MHLSLDSKYVNTAAIIGDIAIDFVSRRRESECIIVHVLIAESGQFFPCKQFCHSHSHWSH
jgi:hypothetical protein